METQIEDLSIDLDDIDISEELEEGPIDPPSTDANIVAEKLREKYESLGQDMDTVGIAQHKADRRALCNRLETDPEFKQQYLAAESEKQKARTMELLNKIQRYNNEEDNLLPDDDDLGSTGDQDIDRINRMMKEREPLVNMMTKEEDSTTDRGVYIRKVKKIVIKF
jgi:hypothetical protein